MKPITNIETVMELLDSYAEEYHTLRGRNAKLSHNHYVMEMIEELGIKYPEALKFYNIYVRLRDAYESSSRLDDES